METYGWQGSAGEQNNASFLKIPRPHLVQFCSCYAVKFSEPLRKTELSYLKDVWKTMPEQVSSQLRITVLKGSHDSHDKVTISLTFKKRLCVRHFVAVLTIETKLLAPVFQKQNIERLQRLLVPFQDGGRGAIICYFHLHFNIWINEVKY